MFGVLSKSGENNRVWLAAYTKPRNEKKVSERLVLKGFEVYCPLREDIRQWSDRKKKVKEPLFKSYVFVHVSEQERLSILEDPGVVQFVFWLGKPAVVKDSDIEEVRVFLEEYPSAIVNQIEIKRGTKVKVSAGPLKDQKGQVHEVRGHKAVLIIENLGLELLAEIHVNKISTYE